MKQKRSAKKMVKSAASAKPSTKVTQTKKGKSQKPKVAAQKPIPGRKVAKSKTSAAPAGKISPVKKLQPKKAKTRAATPQPVKVIKRRTPVSTAAGILKAQKKMAKKFVPKPLKVTTEFQAIIEEALAKIKKKFSLNPDTENSDSIIEFSVFRRIFGVSPNTAKIWVRYGFIACSKIGRFRFVYNSDIHGMMRRFRE